jgi:hypothetical protein
MRVISEFAAHAYLNAKTTFGLLEVSTYCTLIFHVVINTQPSR